MASRRAEFFVWVLLALVLLLRPTLPTRSQALFRPASLSRKLHGTAGAFDLPLRTDAGQYPTTDATPGAVANRRLRLRQACNERQRLDNRRNRDRWNADLQTAAKMIVPLYRCGESAIRDNRGDQCSRADGGTGGSGSVRIGYLAGDVSQNRVGDRIRSCAWSMHRSRRP
jgi:hypothetical protein